MFILKLNVIKMQLEKPNNPTDVYLILHESAFYPRGLEYEYMTGSLRNDLQKRKFGPALTDLGYQRTKKIAGELSNARIEEIITDEFTTPLETARVIAYRGLDIPQITGNEDNIRRKIREEGIVADSRIAESDLSYLTRERFGELFFKSKDDPFIFTMDWYAQASQNEKDILYNGHVEVWNQAMKRNSGKPFAFVLHVEGMQFFMNELLERPRDKMVDLHFKKGNYAHVKVFPDRNTIVSF